MKNAENCMKVAITPWKSDFFHIRKITFFQGTKMLEFSSRLFWRHEKAISFEFGKFAISERHNIESFLSA